MIEREKLQHLIENIGIPKLCLILLLGISLIIVSIPSGKTKKNAQSTETTAKEDSTDLYVKKQEKRLVNALKHVEGVGKVKVMITVNSSKEAVVNKDSPYEQSSSEKEKTVKEDEQTVLVEEDGRKVPKHAHGTTNLKKKTSSTMLITDAVMELYDRIVDKNLLIRRINITANKLVDESFSKEEETYEQLDLFTDYTVKEQEQAEEEAVLEREKRMQQTMLTIKKKFGKNAILKGMNLQEGATAKDRNEQIGGHKA